MISLLLYLFVNCSDVFFYKQVVYFVCEINKQIRIQNMLLRHGSALPMSFSVVVFSCGDDSKGETIYTRGTA